MSNLGRTGVTFWIKIEITFARMIISVIINQACLHHLKCYCGNNTKNMNQASFCSYIWNFASEKMSATVDFFSCI